MHEDAGRAAHITSSVWNPARRRLKLAMRFFDMTTFRAMKMQPAGGVHAWGVVRNRAGLWADLNALSAAGKAWANSITSTVAGVCVLLLRLSYFEAGH